MSMDCGFNKRVWMAVAEGGRWTAAEIEAVTGVRGRSMARVLYGMNNGGLLVKFDGAPPKYGITDDCITPRQTSVGELLTAMGVR